MTFTLNKDVFKKSIQVKAIKINSKHIGNIKNELKNLILKIPSVKPIFPSEEDLKTVLLMADCPKQFLDKYDCIQEDYTLSLDYNNFTSQQVLHELLPQKMDIPSSYESIGHIAHLNLRDEQLPYKFAIGQIFLDKYTNIKTVINKTTHLDGNNPFRILPFELIAGESNFIAKVSETGCRFEFDYSKVYWNSRLQMEHMRLCKLFKPSEFVADVFAGIGPFAVPTAKKCVVFANDLNPDSHYYLQHNSKSNKVTNRLYNFNLDGRDFIKDSLKLLNSKKQEIEDNLNKKSSKAKKAKISFPDTLSFDHYILNLPATAIEFCDAFRNLFPRNHKLPMIHVYAFFKGKIQKEADSILRQQLNKALDRNSDAEFEELHIHDVRNVAPHKNMYCVTFRLPDDVGYVNDVTDSA
eukprot:NODE_455_length_8260_cov_0.408406.p2 type:complete len:409 gc:universal NODE_455_length_8260_cov_0.408406:1521-295(-)